MIFLFCQDYQVIVSEMTHPETNIPMDEDGIQDQADEFSLSKFTNLWANCSTKLLWNGKFKPVKVSAILIYVNKLSINFMEFKCISKEDSFILCFTVNVKTEVKTELDSRDAAPKRRRVSTPRKKLPPVDYDENDEESEDFDVADDDNEDVDYVPDKASQLNDAPDTYGGDGDADGDNDNDGADDNEDEVYEPSKSKKSEEFNNTCIPQNLKIHIEVKHNIIT